eukprot:2298891-Amphidinium_carterae.2
MSTSLLNELDGGDCNGMSYNEIQTNYPHVWAAREADSIPQQSHDSVVLSYGDLWIPYQYQLTHLQEWLQILIGFRRRLRLATYATLECSSTFHDE